MPSSMVRTYTDPDEYATAMGDRRSFKSDVIVTQSGNFQARLHRIDLHNLWMQHFSQNLPSAAHIEFCTPRAIILFPTQAQSELARDGVELSSDSIARSPADHSYYIRMSTPTSCASMSLPIGEMAQLSEAIVGSDLSPQSAPQIVTPAADDMAKLQRLHSAARALAEDAPQVLEHPEAACGLEQALIEVMMKCLNNREFHEDRAASRQHAAIMRRFQRVIDRSEGQPIYIPELCREVGASVRTLQACCQEHVGMGPKRYLLLRRMNMVRRALHESAPSTTTVTEVATRYGFWQFGRLAVEYKALFGETPSATLARAA